MAPGSWGVTPAARRALVRRPDLWPAALGAGWRLAAPGWWRQWPPRPVPDPTYLRFRAQTMFGGDGDRLLGPEELIDYLMWYREQAQSRRKGRTDMVGAGARRHCKAPKLPHRRG